MPGTGDGLLGSPSVCARTRRDWKEITFPISASCRIRLLGHSSSGWQASFTSHQCHIYKDHFYVLIPTTSPKCADLLRDGRYALQAFPPVPNDENEEFYISGLANHIREPEIRQVLIDDIKIIVEDNEVLFELLLDRVMYTKLVDRGTSGEHPVHKKWRA